MSSATPTTSPLVSVVTPVFNGAKYLRACIESVLAQSYGNWDYTIVDNCSTDDSFAIAREYARRHPQITVKRNDRFVGVVENHNRAFRCISPAAEYCKLVSADDWLYPECISQLVDVAERYPSVGVVGSYAAQTTGVRWSGVPFGEEFFPGRETARLHLLGRIDSFFVPSTVLYRASLVRQTDSFFPGSDPSADLDACLNCLSHGDFGYVHRILSFERIHAEMMTARLHDMNMVRLYRLRILMEFGPEFLSPEELERRLEEQLSDYFEALAIGLFQFRDRAFWRLHRERLDELGYSIYDPRFARAVVAKLLDLTFNPKATTEKAIGRVRRRRLGTGAS